jgi:hypothetical protein
MYFVTASSEAISLRFTLVNNQPTFRTLKCHILPQLYTELLDGSDKVDSLLGAVA